MCNLLLGQNNRDGEYMSFSQVLRNSLSVEKTTPAFCETCKKFTPTNQYARVTDLPQILSINCGLKNEKEMNFLKKQLNRSNDSASETIPAPVSSTPIKPCRYGLNCSRVDCHFAHSDRKSPASSSTANTAAPTTSNNGRSNIWFPHNFTAKIDEANELKITVAESDEDSALEKTSDSLSVANLAISDDATSKIIQEKSYKLTAVVCEIINGNQKNLVALIYVDKPYHKARATENDGQWYIFNDFRYELNPNRKTGFSYLHK